MIYTPAYKFLMTNGMFRAALLLMLAAPRHKLNKATSLLLQS